ncbi:peptide deformylase [Lactiplantibacillus garii]|uniref:Peptide deformylase n=1 Tax=Lactiplantibacillus garii TaxID=2306423 RepID=A0A3R8KLK8_9LACO|nr:peptide deformylase [Lactiplantibacillus garii]RRK10547.1 peptide deformylase [Lactiplantibacillus garii]
MIKPVVHDPAALQTPAQPASRSDRAVITNLLDTLAANQANCVGMAANMIGVNKRIIVVQMGPLAIPMINPQIIKKSGPYQTSEGCLSLTGERPTTRYKQITVKFDNQNFAPQQQTFNDFIAQIIQHEVDHCDGILI